MLLWRASKYRGWRAACIYFFCCCGLDWEKKDTCYCGEQVNRRDRERHVFIFVIRLDVKMKKKDTCYYYAYMDKREGLTEHRIERERLSRSATRLQRRYRSAKS